MTDLTLSPDRPAETTKTDITTNREFLEAIFGPCVPSADARPLLCSKSGDPDAAGWSPEPWGATPPENPALNWYVQPATFAAVGGKWKARKNAAVAVYAVMLDARSLANAWPS